MIDELRGENLNAVARDAGNRYNQHRLARADCPVASVVDNEINDAHRCKRYQRDYVTPFDAVR